VPLFLEYASKEARSALRSGWKFLKSPIKINGFVISDIVRNDNKLFLVCGVIGYYTHSPFCFEYTQMAASHRHHGT